VSIAPRTTRWAAPLLFSVLLAGFGAGIWGSYRAIFPAKGLHRVTGIFQRRAGDALILVRHDAVAGLMEEMPSMAFFSDSREFLDAADLHPGERIRLTVRQVPGEPDKLVVVEIVKIR
jgi:hypothetical protein